MGDGADRSGSVVGHEAFPVGIDVWSIPAESSLSMGCSGVRRRLTCGGLVVPAESSLQSEPSGGRQGGTGSGPAGILRRWWIAALAPVLVVVLLLPNAWDVSRRPVDADLERVYGYLASLPKDTLVAAHPDLANFVPVRARRSILASTEVSMAWMENYYAQMKPRMVASLRAAYATRIEEVDAELGSVRGGRHVDRPWRMGEPPYFFPFRELESELMARGAAMGFALRVPPPDRVLFRSGDYYVIRVGACEDTKCP